MPKGNVKWFKSQKGYGFIQPQGGTEKDVFVHICGGRESGAQAVSMKVKSSNTKKSRTREKRRRKISRFNAERIPKI